MPFASFSRVREVSSEDEVHKAESLIRPQQGKKWKTKDAGEKSAYVILEMDAAQQITGIDIGNEHSAYVEVLVGKSSCAPSDFVEILITCSFMTPIECRSSNNPNRVRCFSSDALVPNVSDKKWSLIKIICTQPFNKHVQYGLSFVKIHVASGLEQTSTKLLSQGSLLHPVLSTVSDSNISKIGMFNLREDSPDSEVEGPSSLFSRWKQTKNSDQPTAAASIRAATTALNDSVINAGSQQINSNSRVQRGQAVDRNRDALVFGNDVDEIKPERKARLEKQIEADRQRRSLEIQKLADAKHKEKQASKDVNKIFENKQQKIREKYQEQKEQPSKDATLSAANIPETSRKRRSSPVESSSKRVNRSVVYRPFGELLRGVVLVISGIQNPDRSNLRNKALAMGAKYKGDWDPSCTHLICAFKNTPKYNQVKGKGKIVTRSWIEKCHDLRKYIPWRRFALESQEMQAPESDEEIFDVLQRPPANFATGNTSVIENEHKNDTLALYDLEAHDTGSINRSSNASASSGSDTDDDIRRVESGIKDKQPIKVHKDVFEAPTDEEDYLADKRKQVLLFNMFKNTQFFICDDVGSVDRLKLREIIHECGGQITETAAEASFAVSHSGDVHIKSLTGPVVRPLWIYECYEANKKIPYERYVV